MATITVPSDPTLPVAGAEIKAAPLKDWITNIRTFIEATNIDEANVDTAGADGIVGKSINQTITGLKTFSNTAAAAGGLREVAKFEINPASGTAAANDGLRMTFTADDAGGNATAVGYVDLKLTDASTTSEDSEWRFSTISNASSVTPLVVNATSITMTTGTVAIGTNATIGGGLTVTGTGIFGALTVGSAAISEAELEMLDGLTGGTVTASKAVVVDGNKDIASFRNVTLTGELDAATLDISGDADIDGTLEADAITLGGTALGSLYSPIAGSSSIVTVGTVGTGTWQGSVIASAYLDADTAHLSGSQTFTGDKTFTGTITVGVDGTGKDVTFFGDTSGSKVVWDESADDLIFTNSGIAVGSDATGDIYYRNSSGYLTRLGVGDNGEVLTTNGTIPSWGSAGGAGDFSGPGSATDNAVVRFNGTGGKTGQNSGVTIDDSNNATGFANLTLSGELDAATGDFSGDVDVDGTLEADAITLGGTALGSLYSPIAGSSSIATVGTVGTGTWEGTAVALAYGGTGLVGATDGKIVIADGSGAPVLLDVGSSTAITVLGTVATGTWQGTAVASAYLDSDTAHLSTTQTFTGDKTFTGTLTVGADDTGKDVKFFGASAGAYMEWDESADQLRIVGASADATTSTGKLLLATSLNDINANDVIGKIEFQAPLEVGADAISVSASIKAVAQSTFTASSNATDIIFSTGHSETATEKFRITSQGELGIGGTNYGSDGQVLTSGGAGAAPAWENAASSGHTIQEEGSSLTARANLNFVGAGVTATDDSGNNATKVTVTPTGASLPVTRSDGSTSDPIALTSAALGESLVSDTTPQLGGNLDVNGQSIVSDGSNENIPITPHGTGSVVISKADINAGAIDNTTIGATTASTIAGTTLSATGNVSFDGGSFVFNESGADKDFRIEGDSDQNLFFADASTDRIGIGTDSPNTDLEIRGPAADFGYLTLSTAETTIVNTDPLGRIDFRAPLEGSGSNAVLPTARITAVATETFDATHNQTDLSFQLANDGGVTEKFRITSTGNVGIGTASPAANLHVETDKVTGDYIGYFHNSRTSDGGEQYGVKIEAGFNLYDAVFQVADGNNNKMFQIDGGGTTEACANGGKFFIADTANANMTQGITINQGTNANEVLAFCSSDVAHGLSLAATDTFCSFIKSTDAGGGVVMQGLTDANHPNSYQTMGFHVYQGVAADTTKSISGYGMARFRCACSNSTVTTNGNMLSIDNNGNTKFIIDGEGDVFYDGTTNAGNWDDHDDVGLLSAFRNLTTSNKAQDVFGEFVSENAKVLHDTGVITMNDDGHHFVSTKGLNALIIDTIRQEGQRWRKVVGEYQDKIAALESRLLRLEA